MHKKLTEDLIKIFKKHGVVPSPTLKLRELESWEEIIGGEAKDIYMDGAGHTHRDNLWIETYVMEDESKKPVPVVHVKRAAGYEIMPDLPEYESPISGRPISGRVARREDLKKNNCREVDPSESRHLKEKRAEKLELKQQQRSYQ